MPDNSEITRLVDLLISRQDAQQQQLELLGTNARADQARHEQRMAQLETAAAADKTLHEQRMAQMDADTHAVTVGLAANLVKMEANAAADKTLHEQRMAQMEANAAADKTLHEQRMAQMDANAAADKTLHEQRMAQMDADSKATAERLENSLAKTDEVLLTFGKVQVGVLEQMKGMNTQLLELHQGMKSFHQRQDEFNVIFLEEIREIKSDVRVLKNDVQHLKIVVTQQHEERLRRLEDFMNGSSLRKAS